MGVTVDFSQYSTKVFLSDPDMKRNVGGIDRTARLVIGTLAILAGITAFAGYLALGTVIASVALVVGVILLVTGTAQKCPINEAAGIDTTE